MTGMGMGMDLEGISALGRPQGQDKPRQGKVKPSQRFDMDIYGYGYMGNMDISVAGVAALLLYSCQLLSLSFSLSRFCGSLPFATYLLSQSVS